MVCQRLREGGGYHQEDVKHASAGKDKKGCKKRLHERLQDDERHGPESKCVAHEDKSGPLLDGERLYVIQIQINFILSAYIIQ